jgi:aspartate aminotransferase-like enzyme
MRYRLFVPGPTAVAPEVLAEMARPPISHRSEEFKGIVREVLDGLRPVMRTKGDVFVTTSPGTAVMEAAIRNCVRKRSLHLVTGAFGDRWHKIALACGKEADALAVEWGQPVRPEDVARKLAGGGDYDAVCVTHSETSTGVLNPLGEIAAAVRRARPDALLLADTVSSLGGVPVEVDAWGLDVCLASVQKALALPPGLAVVSVSGRALERARATPGRGHFLDFVALHDEAAEGQTVATPAVSLFFALRLQLRRIAAEGLEARWRRHAEMSRFCLDWARRRFAVFPRQGFECPTLTVVRNDGPHDTARLIKAVKARGAVIASGYGPLKGGTFRIAHMGEIGLDDLTELIGLIDEAAPPSAAPSPAPSPSRP